MLKKSFKSSIFALLLGVSSIIASSSAYAVPAADLQLAYTYSDCTADCGTNDPFLSNGSSIRILGKSPYTGNQFVVHYEEFGTSLSQSDCQMRVERKACEAGCLKVSKILHFDYMGNAIATPVTLNPIDCL